MNKLQEIEDVNCSGKCREESCSRPRVAFSVFCEEHSAAELYMPGCVLSSRRWDYWLVAIMAGAALEGASDARSL